MSIFIVRPCRLPYLIIFRCSAANEIIRTVTEDKFKEALNIRPDYDEHEHKYIRHFPFDDMTPFYPSDIQRVTKIE